MQINIWKILRFASWLVDVRPRSVRAYVQILMLGRMAFKSVLREIKTGTGFTLVAKLRDLATPLLRGEAPLLERGGAAWSQCGGV